MTGRIGWGAVSDRIYSGRRKRVLVLVGVLSTALALLLGLVSATTPVLLVLAVVLLAGVCMVGHQGVSYALIGEIAGTSRTGAALGIVVSANSLGAIFGTPAFGYLVDRTGSYSLAWNALAGAILLGVLALVFFFDEPAPRERLP